MDGEVVSPSAQEESTQKFQGHRYWITVLVCIALGISWMTWGWDYVSELFRNRSEAWFGRPWHQLPDWINGAVGFMTASPVFVFALVTWFCVSKLESTNRSLLFQADIRNLSKARFALQQGLASLDKIEADFKVKVASYERLQKQLDELAAVKDINVEELQKKLNAIALATRGRVWFGRIAAFVLGILSSLFSSYLWDLISKGA